MKKIIVKVDSASAEVWSVDGEDEELILKKEIPFEENYDERRGLHFNEEEALVRLMERVSANYFNHKIEAYAVGLFSEIRPELLNGLKREIFKRAKIELKVI